MFVQMEGPALLQREIITKKRKYIDEIEKLSSPEPLGQISTKLGTKHPWVKGIKVYSNEGLPFSKGR